ncbi:MAG: hypothetical protein ACI3W7_08265 [Oscillospiraceae bacterium]
MSAKKATRKGAADGKARSRAARDRRTNIINIVLVAVFALGLLALFTYSNGWYLPAVTVLTADDYQMNAVTFNYFYRDCYDSFQNAYGEMLEAQGSIKANVSLAEQEYSKDYSWADFFYDTAVENAKRSSVVYLAAQEAGFELSEDDVAAVDQEIEAIRNAARANGYTIVNNFLQSHYGKGATLKSYREYLLLTKLTNTFSGDSYSSITCTDEDMTAWFAENYPDAGDEYDYSTVNFRMIYFPFSGYAYDSASGYYDYSEESRTNAMTQLQYISTLYVQGDQTEESFAELAREYSAYLASEGGLYENAVKDDSGVETQVLNWIFADGREPGETAYIEASTGDYLLYWVGEGMPAWQFLAQKGLRTEAWNLWYEELRAGTEITERPNALNYVYLTA